MPDDERLGELLGGAMSSMSPIRACPQLEELAALAEGAVEPAEREELFGHLALCGKCREIYAMVSEPSAEPAAEPVAEERPEPQLARAGLYRWLVPAALAASIAAAAGYTLMVSPAGYKGEPVMELAMQDARTAAPETGADEKEVPPSGDETAPEPAQRTLHSYAAAPDTDIQAETEEPPVGAVRADDNSGAVSRSKAEAPVMAKESAKAVEPPAEERMGEAKVVREGADGYVPIAGTKDKGAVANLAEAPAREMDAGEEAVQPQMKQAPAEPDLNYTGRTAGGYAGGAAGIAPETSEIASAPAVPADIADTAIAESEPSMSFGDSMDAPLAGETMEQPAEGRVKSVDLKENLLVFVPEGTDKSISVTAGDPDDLKAVKEGDRVKVFYKPGDMKVAARIKKIREIRIPVGC